MVQIKDSNIIGVTAKSHTSVTKYHFNPLYGYFLKRVLFYITFWILGTVKKRAAIFVRWNNIFPVSNIVE